jgi:hypothetical protein
MAAKAEPKSTGDEIWYNDAVTERVATWGSEEDAEQALVRELKNGWPWSHQLPDGTRVPGDAKFWNEPFVNVDRKNNRARISTLISNTSPFWRDGPSDVPGQVIGIKVARVAALKVSTKTRIINEAQRMKQAGEIPEGITKTAFATQLASKAGVTPKYVRNNLASWDLWPISVIQ